jgi:hypothetical protein
MIQQPVDKRPSAGSLPPNAWQLRRLAAHTRVFQRAARPFNRRGNWNILIAACHEEKSSECAGNTDFQAIKSAFYTIRGAAALTESRDKPVAEELK